MTSRFDYTKLIVENLGKVAAAIVLVVTSLSSVLGYTVIDNMEKSQEIVDTQKQVAVVANYYNPQEPVVKQKCNCKKLLNKHLRREH